MRRAQNNITDLESHVWTHTLIFAVVLYGCGTWSLTLREERRLRMFENMVLRRIFGPKRDEGTEEWRRIHIEDLSDLYSSSNIIWVACSTYGGEQRCTQGSGGET